MKNRASTSQDRKSPHGTRPLKLAALLLLTVSIGAGARQVAASPSLGLFLSNYEALKTADASINFWQRLACSFALARSARSRP